MNNDKERFCSLIKSVCQTFDFEVNPTDFFLERLEKETDFFKAPASTKYHGCCEGGLLRHSILTYERLLAKQDVFSNIVSERSAILVGLLHDLCKINTYKKEPRNKKINGSWQVVEEWVVKDDDPLGHGEKSLIILYRHGIGQFLSREEESAIRWHMGGWDTSAKDYAGALAASKAADMFPLVRLAQAADLEAVVLESLNPEATP
jgi:hypothetical protein